MCFPSLAFAKPKIHKLIGKVLINGIRANIDSIVSPNDEIVVPEDSELVFTLGEDAYLLHGNTQVKVGPIKRGVASSMRLVTGKMLSVFKKRETKTELASSMATMGIRGTAVYMEASPDKLHTCTCYGHTDLTFDGNIKEVTATHHASSDIIKDSNGNKIMVSAPMKGHTDDELRMLEALVGRTVPFDV